MGKSQFVATLVRFFASPVWRAVAYASLAVLVFVVSISFLEFIGVVHDVTRQLPRALILPGMFFLPVPHILYDSARKRCKQL